MKYKATFCLFIYLFIYSVILINIITFTLFCNPSKLLSFTSDQKSRDHFTEMQKKDVPKNFILLTF